MYVFRRTKHTTTLVEMTPTEYRNAINEEHRSTLNPEKRVHYELTTANRARRYVKDGGHHETGLWVDADGKVRYARPDPTGH